MGKNQIKYLKLLGYRDTQEDGAILEHDGLGSGLGAYVWEGDKFESVLANYQLRLIKAERRRVVNEITI